MLKTVRVHDTDETSVEYASVRRVVELASGQVRLELWLDDRTEVSRDVIPSWGSDRVSYDSFPGCRFACRASRYPHPQA
jgi:hypothetical protein